MSGTTSKEGRLNLWFFCFRLALRWGLTLRGIGLGGLRGLIFPASIFLLIIGYIPAGSLELKAAVGNESRDSTRAGWATG